MVTPVDPPRARRDASTVSYGRLVAIELGRSIWRVVAWSLVGAAASVASVFMIGVLAIFVLWLVGLTAVVALAVSVVYALFECLDEQRLRYKHAARLRQRF